MPSPQNIRRLILTAAVTSITIAGSLYGAGIKTTEEIAETKKQRQEATFDEQMKALKGMRSNLTARKGLIETQIRDLEDKIQKKKEMKASDNQNQPGGGQ
ncbi:hypothetical protein N7533_013551 [Penicillium manginii]|uniref:uncharacterized protein n=1 Tax=Penicillium manginii TaxID=203109 RepID=UPI0025469259|nr:uncharacterized protein N7533_013551 [Penicillium manginii]KAJ5733104.1 hypothetical protein N7533_013551 [Penicillium manginii]